MFIGLVTYFNVLVSKFIEVKAASLFCVGLGFFIFDIYILYAFSC